MAKPPRDAKSILIRGVSPLMGFMILFLTAEGFLRGNPEYEIFRSVLFWIGRAIVSVLGAGAILIVIAYVGYFCYLLYRVIKFKDPSEGEYVFFLLIFGAFVILPITLAL